MLLTRALKGRSARRSSLLIMRVAWLPLRRHRPRKMDQLPCCCTPCDFVGLAGCPEPIVERFDHGIMLRCAECGEVQDRLQARMAALPQPLVAADTGAGLAGVWR